jgi:hypothetical protein
LRRSYDAWMPNRAETSFEASLRRSQRPSRSKAPTPDDDTPKTPKDLDEATRLLLYAIGRLGEEDLYTDAPEYRGRTECLKALSKLAMRTWYGEQVSVRQIGKAIDVWEKASIKADLSEKNKSKV